MSRILGREESLVSVEITETCDQKCSFTKEQSVLNKNGVDEIKTTIHKADGILIFETKMFFPKQESIRTEMVGESIVMHFMYAENFENHFQDVDSEEVSIQNTHNILYTTNLKSTFVIPAFQNINYTSIVMSVDFYSKLINENWDVHTDFSKRIKQKKTGYLTPKYCAFNAGIQWCLNDIKYCKYEGSIKKMYFETKIRELLVFQIESLAPQQKVTETLNKIDVSKLIKAKEILESKFTNAPTLTELSKLISLNEFKLKKGFKSYFETTVKGYVTKLRMEYARDLFKNNTANVTEVAEKCGYKDVSNFSSAFKAYYGFTPVSFRKGSSGIHIFILVWEVLESFSVEVFLV